MSQWYGFRSKTMIERGKTTQKAIDTVKDWIKTTTIPQLEEEFIILFLISCLNDTEATKKKIQAYFRVKCGNPQIFNGPDIDSEDIQKLLKSNSFCVIPKRINDNRLIVLSRLNEPDYRKCDIIPIIRIVSLGLQWLQMNDPPDELIVIVDINQVGLMHLTCLKIRPALAFIEYVQEALPVKVHAIHILNANYVFLKILNMFRSFIRSEWLHIIKTYPRGMDMKEFHKVVPPCHLPKDYEGELPLLDELMVKLVQGLRELKPFLEEQEKLRSRYKMQKI